VDELTELFGLLEDVSALTDDQLADCEGRLREAYDSLRENEIDSASISELARIMDGIDQIAGENAKRDEERQKLADDVAALDRRMAGESEAPVEPTQAEIPVDGQGEPDELEEEEDEKQPVFAAGRAKVMVPRRAQPIERGEDGNFRILSAPDLPNRPAGATFTNMMEVAQATCDRLGSFRGEYHGPTQNVRVATIQWARPPEYHLTTDNVQLNMKRIREITSPMAVVAAGGFCGPCDIVRGVDTIGDTSRPVRDSLPGFTASRGCIQFQRGVSIGDVDSAPPNADSPFGWHTEADFTAGTPKLGPWCIPCSPVDSCQVEAAYMRLCFSNFQDRFNPENMAAYQDVVRVAQARAAERRLLGQMRSSAVSVTAPALTVNSLRALMQAVGFLRQWFEDKYRLPTGLGLVAYLPRWLAVMTAIDMSWQAPGDNTIAFATADVERALANYGVRIVWTMESEIAGQDLTNQATPTFVFPSDVQMLIFPSGTYTFLDGGTLDLGIVRDSTLNEANKFETFFESFEGVCKTGYESINATIPLCQSGAAAALAAQACANAAPVGP
jgi:hypothetical protein